MNQIRGAYGVGSKIEPEPDGSAVVVESPEEIAVPSGLAVSRARAVDRVFKGGILSVLGIGALGVGIAGPSYVLSYVFGVGGCVLAGIGFGVLGAAARHFMRFGSTRVALALGASVGLGASVILWGLSGLAPVLERIPFLYVLNLPATFAVLGFGAFIVLLTLGALLRWLAASDE